MNSSSSSTTTTSQASEGDLRRIIKTLKYSSEEDSFLFPQKFHDGDAYDDASTSSSSSKGGNHHHLSFSELSALDGGSSVVTGESSLRMDKFLFEELDMEQVSYILNKDDQVPGPTALHIACEHGHTQVSGHFGFEFMFFPLCFFLSLLFNLCLVTCPRA
jgi:hypothetical protein